MTESRSAADAVRAGDQLAIARLITNIENEAGGYQDTLDLLFPHTGSAHIIGITGSPGSGKSTLVNCLAKTIRANDRNARVGIIAVDPTSPFTGGAVLGDRVRMQAHANDSNIFIRSMASRGALGGIARAADNAAMVLDSAGYDPIIIETVGAGQSEVEIASLAHTTVVVEAPGLGDDVQAAKAGLLEIANIFVLNKAEKSSAEAAFHALEHMLAIGDEVQPGSLGTKWKVPIIRTSAIQCEGIPEVREQISGHKTHLLETGEWEKCDLLRLGKQVNDRIRESLFSDWKDGLDQEKYNTIMVQVMHHQISPHLAVQKLLG